MKPLVSVICIAYNHAPFIKEALHSVFSQTYENLQVIILDDGSKDDSVKQIKEAIGEREVQTIFHKTNQGYTKTFNEGLKLCKGEYVIDLALDDVMKPDFIDRSLQKFQESDSETGVVFSNADYIDQQGQFIGNHNDTLFKKGMIKSVPSGDIFSWILKRYFICTPTMVIRKDVFDRLGGYDEQLAYEDFDFWVRSSRYWKYAYLDEVHLQKRKLAGSMSDQRYRFHFNEQMTSIFKVCQKAFQLCKTRVEIKALRERINYEYRQCMRSGNYKLAEAYRQLMIDTGGSISLTSRFGYRLRRVK